MGGPLPGGDSGGEVPLVRQLALDLREHVIGVAADQPDGTNDDHQNYRQHYRVLSNVLPVILVP